MGACCNMLEQHDGASNPDLPLPLPRGPQISRRTQFTYLLAWAIILCLGVRFFWMNTRAPEERGRLFWKVKVFAHWPDRYCDLGITVAYMESDRKGYPVQPPCSVPPSLIYGGGVVWLGRLLGLNRLTVADSVPLGFLLAASFLFSLAVTFRGSRIWHAVYLAPTLFSPPIFLGLERGNLDLLIFCALVGAISLAIRH